MAKRSVFIKGDVLARETTWMSVEDVMLSELSQTQKGDYSVILFLRGI